MSSEDSGRTFWDLMFSGRRTLLKVVVIVSAIGTAVYLWNRDPAAAEDFVREYWSVGISPAVGYFLGRYVAKTLYRPNRRLVVLTDPGTHTLRPIAIPEEVFVQMTQTGNNVVYHTAYGTPVYLAKSVNFQTGEIDYGWIHELNALTVMTDEQAYARWNDTLNEVLEENLQLMHNPQVIGLGYSRDALRNHLDAFSEALGFKKVDLEAHDPGDGEEPVPEPAAEPAAEVAADE